ncbi:hypothetical protein AB8O55_27705, partial [Saccharopolyspora cebuensis]
FFCIPGLGVVVDLGGGPARFSGRAVRASPENERISFSNDSPTMLTNRRRRRSARAEIKIEGLVSTAAQHAATFV